MRDFEPRRPAGRVEDFTQPFLWMAGLVVFIGLFTLWASFGYLVALAAGLVLRGLIDLLLRS